MLRRVTREFLCSTSAHGYKLLVLPKRTILERTVILVAIISFAISAFAISWKVWVQILETPVSTQADLANYPIWNYPFPAVTVCNFNTISKARAHEVAETLTKPDNMTVNEMAWHLRTLYHLIDPLLTETSQELFNLVQDILDKNKVDVAQLMQYLAPSCDELLQRCTWKGQHAPCNNLFDQIKTSRGFCCSFNYFALKNQPVDSYSRHRKLQDVPRRLSATGYQTALEVIVNTSPADYFATPFSGFGHRITVHYPYNFPGGNALSLLQSPRALLFIGVKPFLYRTDNKINALPVNQRKCVFREEGNLLYFHYTYYNCISECRANITRRICGCVPFYNHYITDSRNGSRICNLRDISCLYKNKAVVEASVPKFDWSDDTIDVKYINNDNCFCVPDCNFCSYSIEGAAGDFQTKFAPKKPFLYGGVTLVNQSVFRLFFDDLISMRYTTSVKHYWHTILGLFGGILGLFTGISFISLFEIFYFLTVRPVLTYIIRQKTLGKPVPTATVVVQPLQNKIQIV